MLWREQSRYGALKLSEAPVVIGDVLVSQVVLIMGWLVGLMRSNMPGWEGNEGFHVLMRHGLMDLWISCGVPRRVLMGFTSGVIWTDRDCYAQKTWRDRVSRRAC